MSFQAHLDTIEDKTGPASHDKLTITYQVAGIISAILTRLRQ